MLKSKKLWILILLSHFLPIENSLIKQDQENFLNKFKSSYNNGVTENIKLQEQIDDINYDDLLSRYDLDNDFLTTNNPCLVQYCTKGRECIVNSNGQPDCICQRSCAHRKKSVCGTDGIIYDNHCELHRAACLIKQPLGLQRMEKCLTKSVFYLKNKQKNIKKNTNLIKRPISEEESLLLSTENYHEAIVIYKETTTTAQQLVKSNTGTTESSSNFDEKIPTSFDDSSHDYEENLNFNPQRKCTFQEYEIMKDNLLLYSHARLMSQDNNHSKDFLVSIMFSHYDQNNNGHLENDELHVISLSEHLDELSNGCALNDMLEYDDTDHDGQLSVTEFNQAFSKLYSVSVVSLDKSLEVNHLSARIEDNVEIKCDVTGSPSPPILWKRNNVDLSILNDDDVRVFNDGSLYLTRIQLMHAGNYSCHAQRNKDIVQTHVLTVHTIPEVHVMPRIQSKRPSENCEISCHVIGEPFPKVEWLKNDEPIKIDYGKKKFEITGNGTTLKIHKITYSDTGAYMCEATNIGGTVRDISSLVVQNDPTPNILNDEKKFIVFHEFGIAVYEPDACRLHHQIQGTDLIPGTDEYVCGETKKNVCSWGQAINVGINYIYVSQPNFDRILIISILQMVIVDIISTDKYPVELFYAEHFDQVWILNWRNEKNVDAKTIQVIRDAKKKRKHHTVHPEPIDGQFDLVKNLFIPSSTLELVSYNFKYGYVTHKNQRGLYKLDLANLRYTKSIDLTLYNCVPENIDFSAIYGYVIISCREPITNRPQGQLVLDYLTESVLTTKIGLTGIPKISPDSRNVATIDHTKDGVVIVVQKITSHGLEFEFDVKTNLNISDITFYESQTTNGYDLYASASDKEDILFLNLYTGKVEMITGVGTAMPTSLMKWNNPVRPLKSSGLFGKFMVTTANNALFVLNGKMRMVNCEIGGILHPSVIIWTKSINSQHKTKFIRK